MNERDIFRAIGDVDDDLIEGASRPPRHIPLRIYLSTAVAACLCIVAIFAVSRVVPDSNKEMANGVQRISSTEATPYAVEGSSIYDQIEGIELDPPASATGAAPQGYGSAVKLPVDFSFQISWEDSSYSSENMIFSRADTDTISLPLTQQELQEIWELIVQIEEEAPSKNQPLILEYTAYGESCTLELSQTDDTAQKLVQLLEEAANRVP